MNIQQWLQQQMQQQGMTQQGARGRFGTPQQNSAVGGLGQMPAGPPAQQVMQPDPITAPLYKDYDPSLGMVQHNWNLLHGKRQKDYGHTAIGQAYDELRPYLPDAIGMVKAPYISTPWSGVDDKMRQGVEQYVSPEIENPWAGFDEWGGYVEPTPAQQAQLDQQVSRLRAPALAALKRYEDEFGKWEQQYLSPTLKSQLAQIGLDLTKAPGVSSAAQTQNMINAQLKHLGVEDLNDLAFAQSGELYNRRTGQGLPNLVHNFRGGKRDGSLQVYLKNDGSGRPVFKTDFNKPSRDWVDTIVPALIIGFATGGMGAGIGAAIGGAAGAAGAAGGAGAGAAAGTAAGTGAGTAAGTAAGTSLGAQMAGQAIVGGLNAAGMGGNVGKGMLTGAVGAGIGGGVNAWNPGSSLTSSTLAQQAINKGLSGALTGGANAAISGRPVGTAVLGGGLGGALAGAGGQYVPQGLANVVGGGLGQYIASKLTPQQQQAATNARQQAHTTQQQPVAQNTQQQSSTAGLPDYVRQRIEQVRRMYG